MSKILRDKETPVTEEILESLIGKIIHVPNNILPMVDSKGNIHKENVWFAGMVAGYDVVTSYFDFANNKFIDTPFKRISILLTDGMMYTLAPESEILELTDDEFYKMVEENAKMQDILVPETSKDILLPGKDF